MNSNESTAQDVAQNIRAALQNLNELVEDAYHSHEIIVTYDIKRPMAYEDGSPKIFAIVSQEV